MVNETLAFDIDIDIYKRPLCDRIDGRNPLQTSRFSVKIKSFNETYKRSK